MESGDLMQKSYLHTPDECSNFVLMKIPKFDHKQALLILMRRILLFNRVSRPHISGDLFVKLVDYAPWDSKRHKLCNALRSLFLMEEKKFIPRIKIKKLRRAESLFIPGHEFVKFLEQYENEINAKIIFCGNSDFNFQSSLNLPRSVIRCYLQNSAISDNKFVFTLPIGLENLALGRSGLRSFHKYTTSHSIFDRVLIPPMSPTNKARYDVLWWGRENPEVADSYFELLPPKEYFSLTKRYKFIFCSEGNGFDVHRIWETLYQGSFPVLLSNPWSETLKYLNLPILFVKKYSEITPILLKKFYAQNRNFSPKSCEALWEPFWREIIQQIGKQ